MKTEQEHGGYGKGVLRIYGSFQINGTSNPDVIRDGNTNLIESVVRDSAGLFTVTLREGATLPARCVTEDAWPSPIGTPVKVVTCGIVVGSYSQATRSFQVQTNIVASTAYSAYTDPAVGDPDDNSRVNFELVGSRLSVGTDAA